jgi:hypothetical protein
MNARVRNRQLNVVLGTNGEGTINRNERQLIEFATDNE